MKLTFMKTFSPSMSLVDFTKTQAVLYRIIAIFVFAILYSPNAFSDNLNNLTTKDSNYINFVVDGLYYYITGDETCQFQGSDGNPNVNIPSEVVHPQDGKLFSVTSLSQSCFLINGAYVRSLSIPSSISIVPSRSFESCSNLEYLSCGSAVIENGAFARLENLKTVILTDGVQSIGAQIFVNCRSLEEVHLPNSISNIGGGVFQGCSNLQKIDLPAGIEVIEWNMFSGCSSLKEIKLPGLVTEIGNNAFYGCSSLTSIEIPDNVHRLGQSAFSQCGNLYQIVMPNTIAEIGRQAFAGCKSLQEISLPSNLTVLPNGIFWDCTELRRIHLPEKLKIIESRAFCECINLSEIVIPDGVSEIEADDSGNNGGVFDGCINLEKVVLPGSLTVIEERLFDNCTALKSIVIPDGVKEIKTRAFFGCTALENVTLSNNTEIIGIGAFEGCENLREIIIPDKVKEIAFASFRHCKNLEKIVFGSSLETIGDNAFLSVPQPKIRIIIAKSIVPPVCPDPTAIFETYTYTAATLYIPKDSYDAYKSTLPWSRFINMDFITEEANVEKFELDGVVYRVTSTMPGDITCEVYDITRHDITTLTIPECVSYHRVEYKVTSIADDAFAECRQLSSLTLPSTIKTISDSAFVDCVALVQIVVEAIAPPVFLPAGSSRAGMNQVFDSEVFLYCCLYVPDNAVASYQGANVWNKFSNILPMSSAEVNEILVEPDDNQVIFDLQGRRVDGKNLSSGIYIINNKKVIVSSRL